MSTNVKHLFFWKTKNCGKKLGKLNCSCGKVPYVLNPLVIESFNAKFKDLIIVDI